MREFMGFLDDANQMVPMPAQFFTELLTQIDDLAEMRVTLFALGLIGKSGDFGNSLLMQDFTEDNHLMAGLGNNPEEAQTGLLDALERAVQRGSILRIAGAETPSQQTYFFLNTPRGRLAAQALKRGESLPATAASVINTTKEKPNLFALYEANLGPLTPMIADTLREAEKVYPPEWVEEAMKIAVQNNIRRWRYVEAILKSWKEEGRHGGDQQNLKEDYRRYVKGKYGKFVKH
jgi:DNA replication protein